MGEPQQPEIRRSGRGQVDPEHWQRKEDKADRLPEGKGRRGPVPEENRPGHRPDRDQDRPEGPPG